MSLRQVLFTEEHGRLRFKNLNKLTLLFLISLTNLILNQKCNVII